MVRGFVHQQNIGTAEQNAGQGNAHLPSAGKRAYVAINLVVFKAQAMEHFTGLRFQGVSAKMLILFLDFTKAGQHAVHFVGLGGIGHFMLQGFQLMMKIAHASAAGDGFVQHGAPGHLFNVLAEIADGKPLRDGDFAFVRLFFAHHHAKKRRLACSVRADQADFFARVELE